MKKLCVDNIVIIELYPSYFYVKDLDNGKVLFNGGAEHGLYKLPQGATTLVDSMISSSCCHVSINIVKCHKKLMVNKELWHNRLGHTHLQVVKNVLKYEKLLYIDESSSLAMCSFPN